MTQSESIVDSLLQEVDADEFMRDVGFDPSRQGKMHILKGLDLIESDLQEFSRAVVRRTGELMPELVKRGVVREDQAKVVAKLMTYYLAEKHYHPKYWDESWSKIYRRMMSVIRADMPWGGSGNLHD